MSSGVNLAKYKPERIGIVIGSSHSGLIRTEEVAVALINGSFSDWTQKEMRKVVSSLVSNTTSVIANLVGSKGRAMTISSACASSNSAVGVGADLIRFGEADVVVCGGCDTISLSVLAGFNALRALAPEKTAPFSRIAGLNIGEGAGILVLEASKNLDAAKRTDCIEVLGYGLSGDAHHATAPDEEGRGAEAAMRAAMMSAFVEPADIDYVNAHGTGTVSNDIAEARAYRRMFGNNVPISSLKSYFGHTLGASGIVELISAAVITKRGKVPPNLRLNTVREGCDGIDLIENQARDHSVSTMLVNNYGFGGNNSSLCIGVGKTRTSISSYTAAPDAVEIVGTGCISVLGADISGILDRFKLKGGRLMYSGGKPEENAVNKPNFRTPELKPFARIPLSAKLEVATTTQALGNNAELFADNAESGLVSGRVFGAQKPTETFMKSVFAGDPSLASAHHFPMTTMNASVGQNSIIHNIRGYVTAICGSASALGYALDLLKWRRQDRIAVASGDENTDYLDEIYRQSECMTVDRLYEAGGAVAFERQSCVRNRGGKAKATVEAWCLRQDAEKIGPSPSGEALCSAIEQTLLASGLLISDIDAFLEVESGSRTGAAAAKKAKKSVLSGCGAKIKNMGDIIGFSPSAGCPIAVATAIGLFERFDDLHRIMIFGSDIVGDSFSFIVRRPQ